MPPTEIPAWLTRVASIDALSELLVALGRQASVVRVPEREPPSVFEDAPASSWRERQLVLLGRSPIHLVNLYAARDGRTVNLAYHHVVRVPDASSRREEDFEARMGQSFRGLLMRTRSRVGFVGGVLAQELQRDAALRAILRDHLAPKDDLHVVPDLRRGFVRIVHVHPVAARRPLIAPEPTAFHEGILSEALFCAFERIALHVRTIPNRVQSRSA